MLLSMPERLLNEVQHVTPPLQHGSRPMSSMKQPVISSIKTFPLRWSGSRQHANGLLDREALLWEGCTMLTPHLESAFTFDFFSPQSKVPLPLRIFAHIRMSLLLPSEKHASHVDYWRMIESGINVWKKQGTCRQVVNSATYL